MPLQLVDGVNTTADIQPALPLAVVLSVDDGFGLSVGHWVAELLHFAASLGERVSLLVPHDSTEVSQWVPSRHLGSADVMACSCCLLWVF